MSKEEEIADSLRFCREIETYYKSGYFENPQNIYEWEKYLPIAKEELERQKKEHTAFDDKRLQDAIDFANRILKGERLERKQPDKDEEYAVSMVETLAREEMPGTMERPAPETLQEQNSTENQEDTEEEDISFTRIMLQRMIEVVLCIGIALGLSAALNHYVGTHTVVEGSSMETTLHDEDNLLVDKISYRFHEPERFDIVVFPFDDSTYYIKRIIGLPNETVQIINGKICINGEILQENYGLEQMDDPGNAVEPITLGADEYFVLGDNRNHSKDSRSVEVGVVKRDKIIGKAIFRIYPFQSFGKLE